MKLKTAHFVAGAIIISAVAFPLASFANSGERGSMGNGYKEHKTAIVNNMVIGTVTAVSGTTLTVTDAKGVVYVVDASTAKIDFGLPVSSILVGDKVVVTGPVTGATKVAKTISNRSVVNRNTFMGTVTAVNGTTLSVDVMVNKVKTSYLINTATATLSKGMGKGVGATILISDIKVGDKVFAIGTASGTTVTATSVRDLGQFKKMMNKGHHFGQFKMGVFAPHGPGRR